MPYSLDDIQRAAQLGFKDFANLPPDLQQATQDYLYNTGDQSGAQVSNAGHLADIYKRYQEVQGTAYGDRMRALANRPNPLQFATVNHEGIDAARQNTAQSYAQQQGALQNIQNQVNGNGPSVAAVQSQQAQDAAMRGMSGQSGAGLRGALMSGGMQNAAVQGAQARAGEIQGAQQMLSQGTGQMRGQSLQDYGQGLQNAYQASALNLGQQQQDMQRRLQLEKLAMTGYRQDIMGRSGMANIEQQNKFAQQGVQDAYTAAALNSAGSGIAQGMREFGSQNDAARGGKSWGDWNPEGG